MYQYVIEAPDNVKSVQITGTFDNWSKSLPEITTPPFEQTITLPEKQDIIFKFIIDGNWTTLDSYPIVTDEHGNANNVVHAEHLILVEEEKEEEPERDDSLKLDDEGSAVVQVDEPVVLAVTDGDEVVNNVEGKYHEEKEFKEQAVDESKQTGINAEQIPTESLQEDEGIKEYVAPEKSKQVPVHDQKATGIDPTSSSSSFAAVSSPPTSSDFEHIDGSPSSEEPTPHKAVEESEDHTGTPVTESSAKFPTATANAATATATAHAAKKPEKPTLLAHPSESTLRAPTSSGSQTPVIGSSSSFTTTPNQHDSIQHALRIPGSFDNRPSVERQGSGTKRESLISKFKNLFK